MKKLKLCLLLFPAAIFAQQVPQKIEMYNYTDGVRDLLPAQVLEVREDRIDVYNYQFGIKDLFPQKTIENTQTEIKVFEIRDGIQQLFPTQVFEKPIFEQPIFKNVYQPFQNTEVFK